MKFFAFNLVLFSVCFSVSCSKKQSGGIEQEIVIDEGYKTAPATGEIIIEDRSLTETNNQTADARAGRREVTRIIADNSKITTMYDGYGNKTETRFFDNNPLLNSVIVRTSAAGDKQVFVNAQNGSVGHLPENMFERVLSAPANDLAAAANIFEGRREPTALLIAESDLPLQPMPSYKFPVRTPLPQIPQPEAVEPAEPIETPDAPAETAAPPPKAEKPAPSSSGAVD